VKNIGKPCAGKLQARFDEGGLVNTTSSLLYLRGSFRWDWPAIMKELSIDEEAIRRAVEAEEQYHGVRLAERKENYGSAAELYEKVLAHNGSHIQARFSLARLYRASGTLVPAVFYSAIVIVFIAMHSRNQRYIWVEHEVNLSH